MRRLGDLNFEKSSQQEKESLQTLQNLVHVNQGGAVAPAGNGRTQEVHHDSSTGSPSTSGRRPKLEVFGNKIAESSYP